MKRLVERLEQGDPLTEEHLVVRPRTAQSVYHSADRRCFRIAVVFLQIQIVHDATDPHGAWILDAEAPAECFERAPTFVMTEHGVERVEWNGPRRLPWIAEQERGLRIHEPANQPR